ncbi:IS701 family transposase [Kocuria arenosa]|uniref:IS701 family transposase n=1 Tax=Kocuria arenosa TaxID=3071446 RepID=UPI0034D3FB7E
MRADQVADVRERLAGFVGEVFASLVRKDQRAKGSLYLQGLMLEGRRKSMQPMGERLGIDYQQLQQFVSASPWPVEPVRQVLAGKVLELIRPEAWVVDDTGFVKDGTASPGVARQYSGTLGKVGNCQIAVSVHAVTDAASCPMDWRLFLPQSWDETCAASPEDAARVKARRAKAQIPDTVGHHPKWELAIEMLEELAVWGHRPPVLVADAGYGEVSPFRTALTERGIPYVVAIKSTTSVHRLEAAPAVMDYSGRGPRPRTPRYHQAPSSVKDLVMAAREDFIELTWRTGTRTSPGNASAAMAGRFAAIRVRPANRTIPRDEDGALPAAWLLAEWPPGAPEPTDYWLATLGEDTPLAELVRLAKIRWRVEHDYRELKHGLGLDHFEGRTWAGWHHHATLVSAARLFATTLRLEQDPKAPTTAA